MIDHTSIAVKNFEESLNFYDKTLSTLGYERIVKLEEGGVIAAGYGKKGKSYFWISPGGNEKEYIGRARGLHIAFLAPDVEAVKAWYKACLELGAMCNGKPGPRKHYHLGYYGTFVVDPNGWRIEACLHNYRATD